MLYDAPLPQAVGYLEENLLRKTLTRNNWNKSESARQLGVSRQGLLKKIRRYGITEGPDTTFADSGDAPAMSVMSMNRGAPGSSRWKCWRIAMAAQLVSIRR